MSLLSTPAHAGAIPDADPIGVVRTQTIPGSTSGSTHELAIGPDDALWITQQDQDRIVRVTTSGAVAGTVELPRGSGPHGIARDRRGHMWVTEEHANTLVELDADGRVLARHAIPRAGAGPHGLAIGCDGRTVWWTGKAGDVVGSLDPVGGRWDIRPLAPGSTPIYIAPGPGCAMYFTELTGNRIGRVSTGAPVREYPIPTPDSRPIAVLAGTGDDVWFTEEAGAAYAGLDVRDGTIREFRSEVPGAKLAALAFDCTGTMWVQYNTPDLIDRIGPGHVARHFPIGVTGAVQHRIIAGPDGRMWFTGLRTDTIGSITTGCGPLHGPRAVEENPRS
jgi:virginiamycin B lyase